MNRIPADGEPPHVAFMMRCDGCSGGGAWFCFECMRKFSEAILSHGGDDGTAFRSLFRVSSAGLDMLLKVPWKELIASGTVDASVLPPVLRFDSKLGTIVAKECAFCYHVNFAPSTHVNVDYLHAKPELLHKEMIELGEIPHVDPKDGLRKLKETRVLVLVFKTVISRADAAKVKWENYQEDKHGEFFHDIDRPNNCSASTNTWVLQISRDAETAEQTALSSILVDAILNEFSDRFLKNRPDVHPQDGHRLFDITRGASTLRRTRGLMLAKNVMESEHEHRSLATSQRRVNRLDGPFGQPLGDSEPWFRYISHGTAEGVGPRTRAAIIFTPFAREPSGAGVVAIKQWMMGVRNRKEGAAKERSMPASRYPVVATPMHSGIPRAGWVAKGRDIVALVNECRHPESSSSSSSSSDSSSSDSSSSSASSRSSSDSSSSESSETPLHPSPASSA